MNESYHKTSINWYPGHMAKTKRLIGEKINLIDIVYEQNFLSKVYLDFPINPLKHLKE